MDTFTMTNKELTKFQIIKELIKKKINGTTAAKKLNLSVRQIKRLKVAVRQLGIKGVIHKARGRVSNNRLPEETIKQALGLISNHYSDFGPTLAQEKLKEIHKISISYETLRQLMIGKGFWKAKPKKATKEYRSWRPRKEYYGDMQQFDGSYHPWLEDRAPDCCLLASIDDATGEITGLEFADNEGVVPVFTFWLEYVKTLGKPLKIYLDRYSTYKQNHRYLLNDPEALTQFERAMTDLDIELIHAHSAPAKGRIEKLFHTLQDRLVKELRLHDISTIPEANHFLKRKFMPWFNRRFAVKALKPGNVHRKLTAKELNLLSSIFSIQSKRTVNNDFTIRFKGQWFQLAEQQPTLVLRKDLITIEERLNGSICIRLKGKYLSYTKLPQRPERINIPIIALATTKQTWQPPESHPWKREGRLRLKVKGDIST